MACGLVGRSGEEGRIGPGTMARRRRQGQHYGHSRREGRHPGQQRPPAQPGPVLAVRQRPVLAVRLRPVLAVTQRPVLTVRPAPVLAVRYQHVLAARPDPRSAAMTAARRPRAGLSSAGPGSGTSGLSSRIMSRSVIAQDLRDRR